MNHLTLPIYRPFLALPDITFLLQFTIFSSPRNSTSSSFRQTTTIHIISINKQNSEQLIDQKVIRRNQFFRESSRLIYTFVF